MILVTGATGLVGTHLLFQLCKTHKYVKAIYRNEAKLTQVEKVFSYYSNTPKLLFDKIMWVKADIVDLPSLEIAFEGVTKVYHTAALVSFDPKDDHRLLKTNVEGTANIVNLCIAKGVEKLCFVSSIAAIGSSVNGQMVTEENEWSKNTATYGISKYYAELEVWRATEEGVAAVVVNPGIIIAPGFWKRSSGAFFNQAAKAPKYHLPGGTGFVGVNDVTSAMMLLMEGSFNQERYILVNQNWTYKTFATLLAKGLKKKPPHQAVSFWMLELFWRWDWLSSHLFGKRRRLSKAVAKMLRTAESYDHSKLKNELNFQFDDLEQYIQECCTIFLEE